MDTLQSSEAGAMTRPANQPRDGVEEVVMILDAEQNDETGPRITHVSEAIASLCGYRMDEVMGQPVSMLYDEAAYEAFLESLPEIKRSGMTYSMEVSTSCADGSRALMHWAIRAANCCDEEVLHFYVTMAPSSSAVPRMKQDAIKKPGSGDEDRASRLESLAIVAGGVAHDFNNVLTSVMANISMASMENHSSTIDPMLNSALSSCESAKKLIGQLLSFAKGQESRRRVVDLGSLMKEAVELSTMGANVRCDLKVSENLPPAEVDPIQIMQVMNNLLINARQAMPNGGVIQISMNSMVRASESGKKLPVGQYIDMRIRDRGCGIAKENLETIFEPFFSTKRDGSGLGLTTTKKIIDQHYGEIEVKSRVNVGTEFRILLPVAKQGSGVSEEGSDEGAEWVEGEGLIMIVEDHEDVMMVGGMMLERLGYQVLKVRSGDEAVSEYRQRKIANEAPVAVIMDNTFPNGMSGDDAASEILGFDPNARIIASSGYFEPSDEKRIKNIGYAAILPKPYSPALLSRTLGDVVKRSGAERVIADGQAVMV